MPAEYRYAAFKNVATHDWIVLDRTSGLAVSEMGEALTFATKREASDKARELNGVRSIQRTPHGTFVLYLTEEMLGVVVDAVQNWENTLSGRFPIVEPWDWPQSNSPDEKSYRKAIKAVISLVAPE